MCHRPLETPRWGEVFIRLNARTEKELLKDITKTLPDLVLKMREDINKGGKVAVKFKAPCGAKLSVKIERDET